MAPHVVQSDGGTMSFEYQVESDRWTWSESLRELHGLAEGQEPTTAVILSRMLAEDRPVMVERFNGHLVTAGPYSCVYRMTDPQNRVRRVIFVGQSEAAGDVVKRLTGFVVDITEPLRESATTAVAAAMEHRACIEQAKGALMLSFGIEEGAAFDLLRAYSNHHNLKLAVVAAHIVAGLSDPAFSQEDPVRSLLDIVVSLSGAAG